MRACLNARGFTGKQDKLLNHLFASLREMIQESGAERGVTEEHFVT